MLKIANNEVNVPSEGILILAKEGGPGKGKPSIQVTKHSYLVTYSLYPAACRICLSLFVFLNCQQSGIDHEHVKTIFRKEAKDINTFKRMIVNYIN